MQYFITSDLHLGHANIIKYCNRPFKNVKHMNDTIIGRWNERIKPEDIVYHVGDFCFKNSYDGEKGLRLNSLYWKSLLNGNIIFIKGNHDKNNTTKTNIESLQILFGGIYINLIHDPVKVNVNYNLNLCGHVHEKWKFKFVPNSIIINIGVDVWNFYPKTLQEIIKYWQYLKRLYYIK